MEGDNVLDDVTNRKLRTARGKRPKGRRPALPTIAPFIAAKTARPQMLRARIRRQRLFDALDAAVRCPLTVVCAGAGWGKTVLVSAWADTRRTPVAWLTLDAHDNDVQLFWSSVAAALRAAGAVPPDSPLAELGTVPTDHVERLRHVARGLGRLAAPTVLVLDDFHEITDDDVLRELSGLLRHPPAGLRLVLLTRTQVVLPVHRMRATGEMAEIRAGELAFTVPEAADLLSRHGLALPDDEVVALVEHTEGWAAGLQLGATFLAGPGGPRTVADFAGDVRAVDEYLADEVLAGQSPHLYRFLLQTSICEHVCGDLADAITLGSDGQRTLEELERVNDFVVRLGAKPRWFRYHHLLRDVLRHRLLLESPTALPELHRRAAGWHAAHNSVFEAIEHAVAAGDWPYVGRLVVTQAAPLIASAHRAALVRLLAQIPPGAFAATPELMVCVALMLFHAGDYDAIEAQLAGTDELLAGRAEAERLPVEITSRSLRVAVHRAGGDMPAVVAETTQLLAMLAKVRFAEVPSAVQYRAIALNNKGFGLLWTDRPDRAQRYLWAASTAARAAGVELVEISALGNLALVEVMSGSVQEAARLAGDARDLAERRGLLSALQTGAAHLALALVHLESGDLAAAERAVQQATRSHRGEPAAAQWLIRVGVQARLALAKGDPGAARAFLDEARRGADPRLRAPGLERWLLLAESEVDLATGDADTVARRYALLSRTDRLTSPERVCAARAGYATHDLRSAMELLAGLRAPMSDTAATVAAGIVGAQVADAAGHGLRATDRLAEAFALADSEGIRRPFLALRDARLDALVARQNLLTHRNADFVAEIQAAMRTSAPAHRAALPAGPLSERETEVLRYLPTMLTAGEIAGELGVSVNTIKAHMRSIYRKLEAPRRSAVVTRAREYGLL
ncbi:LuxR family maltose regulon positive regulatory protein [Krasilnikovia cinnamomea]|uniref:LuxR family maltose regulon positive regulatory protein n=1 Tax=Krasilnikovia cinnamomea TaxID=349313 RepID=A0A4Q7ZF81_9ACTN|nr:LuxR C-terminal-related transcriptional regulator [Krasilnikovia cinnamomea]RZU49420.1 LuxR family maltose regulon positive regulatory protein [Krasilnikovia cinnamomea]